MPAWVVSRKHDRQRILGIRTESGIRSVVIHQRASWQKEPYVLTVVIPTLSVSASEACVSVATAARLLMSTTKLGGAVYYLRNEERAQPLPLLQLNRIT